MAKSVADLLPPSGRAAVMGILNITPDSFSDGGRLLGDRGMAGDALLGRAQTMVEEGVDIFDLGGESTRPGATPVGPREELNRVIPALRLLKRHFQHPVSVDTSAPEVIAAAAAEGADLINDVRSLTRAGALEAAAQTRLPVCLMHMQGTPATMQRAPRYTDVVAEVTQFLRRRMAECEDAGIGRDRIMIDPGFGFGKTLAHNLALFRALPAFAAQGPPLLIGVSRKGMVGAIVDRPVDQRAVASAAMAMLAVQRGARVVRVHDVAATVDALRILAATEDKDA